MELNFLVTRKICRPSNSIWYCPMVRRDWRCYRDNCPLNAVITSDWYFIPHIQDCVNILEGFRTAWKKDLQATTAEMLYGSPIRLLGELQSRTQ
ncbi:hypothetical protein NPIL_696661 [Nephila pilipes]|uniref:Uncharacterized protein n=1 Tax=Nephila pilipes TaxID=299642 RepID=A0A8X6TE93_NEPPI|nr:hypothetical protein NPIL_696661 [Nephila pilipes]